MPKRKPELLLEDILETIGNIKVYIADMGFDDFVTDNKTIDAVIRNLEIIGEAACQLPNDFIEKNAHIPW
jgi:uncharacterized protein with HEPN domain